MLLLQLPKVNYHAAVVTARGPLPLPGPYFNEAIELKACTLFLLLLQGRSLLK